MPKLIPPLGTKGRYDLKAPFVTVPNELYRCDALRTFKEIEGHGQDVFKAYYEPMGLTQTDYTTDRNNGEVIITLLSEKYAPIYVPSSYVNSFPDLSSKNYHHVVLSADMGPLPESVDLTFLKQQMAALVSDVIGLTPQITLGVAPMTGVVSSADHELMETTRQAAIKNRTTDRARVLEQEKTIVSLSERLAILEAIVIENGLIV